MQNKISENVRQQPLRIGVIGYGYWGPGLVRNFSLLEGSTVSVLADLSEQRLKLAASIYPTVRTTTDPFTLIGDHDVEAVVIATPVSAHFQLAKAALQAGKHVLVEKPIAGKSAQAKELIALAAQKNVVLMVDHTFIYTGAVRKLHELITTGELGQLYYYDSLRTNLGMLQDDINVIWDLAVHDLSILDYLVPEEPSEIQADGYQHISKKHAEVATLSIRYPSGFHAHIRVSWLAPVKVRSTLLSGSRKMVIYDDVSPSEKLKVYDNGVSLDPQDVTTSKPLYRAGDVLIPKLDRIEALEMEAQHFIDCIGNGTKPQTDGYAGLRVVKLLEAAQLSLSNGGVFVALNTSDAAH